MVKLGWSDKLFSLYLAPAQFLINRWCDGGPFGLPLLLILMLVVPPMFWMTLLVILAFCIGCLV